MHVCIYVLTGLKISRFTLPNIYHFWGDCKSLWPTHSQYFGSL